MMINVLKMITMIILNVVLHGHWFTLNIINIGEKMPLNWLCCRNSWVSQTSKRCVWTFSFPQQLSKSFAVGSQMSSNLLRESTRVYISGSRPQKSPKKSQSRFTQFFHEFACPHANFFCQPAADSILMQPTFPIASLNRYTPNFSGEA